MLHSQAGEQSSLGLQLVTASERSEREPVAIKALLDSVSTETGPLNHRNSPLCEVLVTPQAASAGMIFSNDY